MRLVLSIIFAAWVSLSLVLIPYQVTTDPVGGEVEVRHVYVPLWEIEEKVQTGLSTYPSYIEPEINSDLVSAFRDNRRISFQIQFGFCIFLTAFMYASGGPPAFIVIKNEGLARTSKLIGLLFPTILTFYFQNFDQPIEDVIMEICLFYFFSFSSVWVFIRVLEWVYLGFKK